MTATIVPTPPLPRCEHQGFPGVTSPLTPEGGNPQRASVLAGLVTAARPRQWVKNGAVLMVPTLLIASLGATGMLSAVIATLAFCLASSSVYLLNDTVDRAGDRHHPTKRYRPIASGLVKPSLALGGAAAGATLALGLGWLVSPVVAAIIATYLAVTAAYSLGLKRIAWLDVGVLAAGFVLRVGAGAAAVAAVAPPLLLMAVFAGATFIALGKRRAELVLLGDEAGAHRSALRTYRLPAIDVALRRAQAVTVLAFGLWILVAEGGAFGPALAVVGALALLAALDGYRQRLLGGAGGDPTRELTSNRALLCGLAFSGLIAVSTAAI